LENNAFGETAMANENSSEPTAQPQSAPEQTPVSNEIKSELPSVESPSISPAKPEAEITAGVEPKSEPMLEAVAAIAASEPAPTAESTDAPASDATPISATILRFALRPRHKRYALLAASVTFAAALGAVIGAVGSGGFASPPPVNVAAQQESKAMQQSVARLSKEVTTLKASIEAANKATNSQVAKISERLRQERAEITGSISAPQTVAAAPTPPAAAVPVPTPRPAPRIAAAESQMPARPPIVPGWTIRGAQGGYIYVESRGDIYQVVPGAPLPGLGPVESIKRMDGRWVVTTPRGIIVSMRDRGYFE
jgi:hypothetical protein